MDESTAHKFFVIHDSEYAPIHMPVFNDRVGLTLLFAQCLKISSFWVTSDVRKYGIRNAGAPVGNGSDKSTGRMGQCRGGSSLSLRDANATHQKWGRDAAL